MRAALVLLAACGGAPAKVATPAMPAPYDPKATLEVARDEVEFTAGDEKVPGTIVHPTSGKWPAIVLFAGSGPTDRDWNSPLLTGTNGSGKLLAEELARHGAVVLRFDKAAIAKNHMPVDKIGPDAFLAEGRAAVAFLRARADVDPARIFTLGNSEGGIHAMATAAAEPAVHGVILLASAGRSMRTILVGQIAVQLDTAVRAGAFTADFAKGEIAKLDAALGDFVAGKPVDPKQASSIPGVQQLVAAIISPAQATVVRPLIATDPAEIAAKLAVPVLVMNGEKDLQVDPELDAKRLAKVLGAHATLVLVPDANHVFKHEPKTRAELTADPKAAQDAYNADGTVLEPVAVEAIERWLAADT